MQLPPDKPEPVASDGDELLAFADAAEPAALAAAHRWRILVVDDEPDVFHATAFGLRDVLFDGAELVLLQAVSAAEAEAIVATDPDIAAILLDVVMETPDAGLRLVERVRAMSGRSALRIILRTGQPGYAPELDVIRRYDINDYKTKAELTQTRLITALTVAIRGYHQQRRIEAHQRGLEKVVAASGRLMTERGSMQSFAEGVLTQICTVIDGHPGGVVVVHTAGDPLTGEGARVLAAAGQFHALAGEAASRLPAPLRAALDGALGVAEPPAGPYRVLPVRASDGEELLVLVADGHRGDEVSTRLLALFASNITLAFDGLKVFRELEHFAHHDRETGLVNRAGLRRKLAETDGVQFAQVAVGELHEVRGALGEAVARRALFDLGQRLAQVLGDDGHVARIEGDRFALALAGPVAADLVHRLHEALSMPVMVGELRLQLPMALGWAQLGSALDQAIDEAGLVVAHTPPGRQLRNVQFAPVMREQVRARMALLGDLRQALDEDRIDMYLQPQLELGRRRVVGAEALMRWRKRDGSIVMPNDFIPIVEHIGAIVELGQRMIAKALDCLRGWADTSLRISVNISVRQLEEPDFPEMLIRCCDGAGVARQRLRLEVTESAFALDGERVGAALALLTQAGFEISIDDFGTGQSSLGRLAEVRVHELKLDRSLVRGIEHDHRARRVARLVVELGGDLGVEVLAEGIETEGQLAVLRELGCALGQGYLFGRPVPQAEFAVPA